MELLGMHMWQQLAHPLSLWLVSTHLQLSILEVQAMQYLGSPTVSSPCFVLIHILFTDQRLDFCKFNIKRLHELRSCLAGEKSTAEKEVPLFHTFYLALELFLNSPFLQLQVRLRESQQAATQLPPMSKDAQSR